MYYGNGNIAAAFRGIILTLFAIGLVVGLALTGSDLINPIRSIANYQRDQVETQRLAEQNRIDLQHYAAQVAAQTQAELQRLTDEGAYRRQAYRQTLEQARLAAEQERQAAQEREALKLHLLRLAGYTAILVTALSLLALSIGAAVRIAKTRPAPARPTADVWTPERRRQAVAAAKQREREQRAWALRQQELATERRFYDLFQAPDRRCDDLVPQPN
jgi:hypothetical protein